MDSEPRSRSPPLRRSPETAARGLLPGTDIGTHRQLPAWKRGEGLKGGPKSEFGSVGSGRQDPERRLEAPEASTVCGAVCLVLPKPEVLEERFGAQAFSPQAFGGPRELGGPTACQGIGSEVHPTLSHSERRFTAVPWSRGLRYLETASLAASGGTREPRASGCQQVRGSRR